MDDEHCLWLSYVFSVGAMPSVARFHRRPFVRRPGPWRRINRWWRPRSMITRRRSSGTHANLLSRNIVLRCDKQRNSETTSYGDCSRDHTCKCETCTAGIPHPGVSHPIQSHGLLYPSACHNGNLIEPGGQPFGLAVLIEPSDPLDQFHSSANSRHTDTGCCHRPRTPAGLRK